MKTTAGLMVVLVVGSTLGLFCAACCGGAGWDVRKAEKAAEEGRYDEAIAIYEQVLAEYPVSDEAIQAPEAIIDVMIARTGSLYEAGEWDNCGRSYKEIVARLGDATVAVERVENAIGSDATKAAMFVEHKDKGFTNEGLKGMEDFLEKYRLVIPAELRAEASDWVCSNRAAFPAYVFIRDLDPEVEAATPLEAEARLERAGSDIVLVMGMSIYAGCEGDAGEEIMAILQADTRKQLRANVEAKIAEWEAECQRESEDALRRASRLGDTCARTVRRLNDLEEKWLYPILTNQRNAVINSVFEMRPHNEKHSETEDALQEIEDEVEAAEWPDEIQQTTLEGVRTEQGRCNR